VPQEVQIWFVNGNSMFMKLYGDLMLSGSYGSYDPMERLIQQWISFSSEVALLVAWPLILSAVLSKEPFGSPHVPSVSTRRILFAGSAAASILFFVVYRLIYPW
jgi:hypothetical protein